MASIMKQFTQTFQHSKTPSLRSRHFVLTGGTNGIGLSVARTLYANGGSLHIIYHREEVADAAEAYIKTGDLSRAPEDYRKGFGSQSDSSGQGEGQESGELELLQCDLEDLNAVTKVSKILADKLERVDACLNIAGIGTNAFRLTSDGYDGHLTANCLAHHVLVSHLFKVLEKTSKLPDTDVRIVSMSSELHRATFGGPSETFGGTKFATIDEFKQELGPDNLYARTKLGNILFTKALVQKQIEPKKLDVLAYATHPGAVATGQQDQFKPAYGEVIGGVLGAAVRPFMSRPDQGAISMLWASISPDARNAEKYPNGSYFTEAEELGKETKEASDQELIDNFYSTSEKVIQQVTNGQGLGW